MADSLETKVETLTTVSFFKSYNAVIINLLQISGHTFIVIYADVVVDVLNLIGCAHYNCSNVCIVFNAQKCENFGISFRIIFSYITNRPLVNERIRISVTSRHLLNLQNVLF
jgi:hypothetical protein